MSNDNRDYNVMLEELHDSATLYGKFVSQGHYTVEVPRKLKLSIARVFVRNNRKLKLHYYYHKNIAGKIAYPIYMFWIDVVCSMFEPNDKGFTVVKFFSEFFWKHIKTYDGEDIEEDMIRVTFYPRT